MSIFDRATGSLQFESNEEVTFPDGTAANVGNIRLRSLSIRPQKSAGGDLYGVFSLTFLVDHVVASDEEGEPHPLLDVTGWTEKVTKRIETEKWVPWHRVPSLLPLLNQMREAGYEAETNRMSFSQVTEWFEKNPKKKTFGDNDNSWIKMRSRQGQDLLSAEFTGVIGELQEEITESIYAGLTDLSNLIAEFAPKMKDDSATKEEKRDFNVLIGNVFGFHTDNKDQRWGNKIALNHLNLDGEEYSMYFNPKRETVSTFEEIFDTVAEAATTNEDEDLDGLFEGV